MAAEGNHHHAYTYYNNKAGCGCHPAPERHLSGWLGLRLLPHLRHEVGRQSGRLGILASQSLSQIRVLISFVHLYFNSSIF
jgi:hypothetical protein